jgi:ATP-dependent Lon protease
VSEVNTQVLPVVPLDTAVVFPHMVATMALETDEARHAVDSARRADGRLLMVPRVGGSFSGVGTIARVEDAGELPNGTTAVILRGLERARVRTGVAGEGPGLFVEAEPVSEPAGDGARLGERGRELRAVVSALAERRGSRRLPEALASTTDPSTLVDSVVGAWSDLALERKVEALQQLDPLERTELVLGWARDALAEIELAERIRNDVSEGMERSQREFLLRQQLSAIRKELGEDGGGDIAAEYRGKLEGREVPEDVRAAFERELDRLERTSEQSPEHGWIRTWLDWVTDLPWGVSSPDRLDVPTAKEILDADHTGLTDVKDRILEFLAVRRLRAERGLDRRDEDERGAGAIIALVGPPGVGKTSLGKSVARAMGRSFVRVALGGVRDEAEIRGHRRTYVGALPGRIARAMKEAGTMNPVMLLDEVDKVGSDWRGDPSSALLEVLDPAQNHTFRDHYLEVDLDLSEVVFIATANMAETIPAPLLDRMEVVRLDGYTEDEKLEIARDHLFGRQLRRNGLGPRDVSLPDEVIRSIVADYTREAGVRNLERELGKLLRKVATKVASGEATPPVEVGTEMLRDALGRPRYWFEAAERTSVPGVATGLAVTGSGGDVLFVEAASMEGDPGLTLTGQLGDVMKESASIALSYVRSHSAEPGGAAGLDGRRVHVHVPAGAVPKDGPSAGVTMVTALASLASGRPVRSSVGMTGEVTLQGRVLPIGGVRQKVLAAHRAGLGEVVLPSRNGPDLDEVPESVREKIRFHLVDDVAQVLEVALEEAPTGVGAGPPSREAGREVLEGERAAA